MIGYHHYKRGKTTDMNFCNMLIVGVCISVVFFIVCSRWFDHEKPAFLATGEWILTGKIDTGYFYFVIKQRLGNICMVLLATFAVGHRKTAKIGAVCVGMLSGFLLCICVTRYFLKGIILYLAYQLPHSICYIIALFLWGEMEQVYPVQLSEVGYNKMYCLKKVVQYIIILLLIMVGIMLECYVNTEIMEKIIKIFDCE